MIITSLLLTSCFSPEKALNNGFYKRAIQLAINKIENNKDVEKNIRIMQTAADHLVEKELLNRKQLVNSPKVKDWIKAQDSYYRVLETLGKANITSDGAILNTYDDMCSIKKELDFKIVDYYYQVGDKLLGGFYDSGTKQFARDAYYNFVEAKKNGGDIYYQDIEELKTESYENGIVYYIGEEYTVGSSFFLKPLPTNADFDPDCDIDIDYGYTHSDESTSETTQKYTKNIVVETLEKRDTAGNVIYEDVYEEVEATVTITTVTLNLSKSVSVNVNDITGQCTISNESFTVSVSDSYEEIEIEGDEEAIDNSISEQSGAPAFFESNLEDKLEKQVNDKLDWIF